MTILAELVGFLRRPNFTAVRVPVTGQSIVDLLKLLGLTVGLAFVSVIIAGGFYMLLSGAPPKPSSGYEDLARSGRFFIAAIIIAPLTEELAFRSWLGKRWGVLLVMPVLLALSAALALSSQSEAASMLSMVGIIAVMGSLGLYLSRYHQTKKIRYNEVLRHDMAARTMFPYAFWGTTIIFALVHMSNYTGDGFNPLLILLVTPQFIIGTILGFVRMRFGLLQAIVFHGAYNSVFVGLSFLGA